MKLADSKYDTFEVPIAEIWVDDSFNCRQNVTTESVEELSQSIADDGLLVPVIIQPAQEYPGTPPGFKYRLVCGFRRMLAHKLLCRQTIVANLRIGLTERQAQMLNCDENLRRFVL